MPIEHLKCGNLLISVIRRGEKRLWPIRAICKQLHINWRLQAKALKSYTPVLVSVALPENPGIRRYECLEQEDFETWLHLLGDIQVSSYACKKIRQLKNVVFFKKSKKINALSQPGEILDALAWLSVQNFHYQNWHTLQVRLEREFRTLFGCTFHAVPTDKLEPAINTLCVIIFNLYNPKPSNHKEHLDALLKRLVSTVGYETALTSSADVNAIINALEKSYDEDRAWHSVSVEPICALIQNSADAMTVEQELLDAAMKLFDGNLVSAEDWLRQPMQSLGGLAPAEAPLKQALDLIGQLEHGVFT
jgi:hypothetical protein